MPQKMPGELEEAISLSLNTTTAGVVGKGCAIFRHMTYIQADTEEQIRKGRRQKAEN